MKALETAGTIGKSDLLNLDKPLALSGKQKAKAIILYAKEEEMDDSGWLSAVESNPSFAFLKNKKEDIYSLADGKPFHI